MTHSDKPISMIMRSRNSSDTIGQVLASLFSQNFTNFELIIVDSGSTDDTCEIIRQYPCKLVQIPQEDYYPGKVLNDAIAMTTGDLIAFVNSDTVLLTPTSLTHLIEVFDDPEIQAAFGRQTHRPEAHTWVRRDYLASFPESGPAPHWMKMSLAFSAMRRTAWEQHHFYTTAWASEDHEWAVWAEQNGLKVHYEPKALVMHSHNYTLRQLHGRRFVEGEADAFIHQDHTSLFKGVTSIIMDSIRDIAKYLSSGDLLGIPGIPIRRFVFHHSYYRGHRWGEKRIAENNKDASVGQGTVLSRHDDIKKS